MTVDDRPPPARESLHDAAATGLEELIEATVALRRQLVTHEAVCRRVLADVEGRVPVGSTLSTVRADTWRSAVTEAIHGFETARRRSRLRLVAMSLDDGTSIAEVARAWGVSRQLASRWVQETRSVGWSHGVLGPADLEV